LQENSSDVKFYADCLKQIDKNSPIAMAVNFEKLKKHKDLSLKRVFESENSLSLKFVAQNDFWEGIRCMLVDRKSLPNWQFENLSAIPQSEVDWYFEEPSWVAQDLQM